MKIYQPPLALCDPSAVSEIRRRSELDWFHRFTFDDYTTPGFEYGANWEYVSDFLQKHQSIIHGADIYEPGCADGLWTCWLTHLGARHIDASDIETRDQFRLIAQAFNLPTTYHPGILSPLAPKHIKRQFDTVCSLGLLYHVHDPLSTLIMYRRYLKPDGHLILETGAVQSDGAYLAYTGAGQIYGRDGNNHFLPSFGFLRSALDEIGMTILDMSFRPEGGHDSQGADVGRAILTARRTHGARIHYYPCILEQLDMLSPEFEREAWYHLTV